MLTGDAAPTGCVEAPATNVRGGAGTDVLEGGAGRDTIQARDSAFDVVDGGTGRDTVRADRVDRVRNVERRG